MRNKWKGVCVVDNLIVHEVINEGDVQNPSSLIRIEYKDRVIQMYTHGEQICCFVMTEDGNDDVEFFCLYEAMQYIDKQVKLIS